MANESLSIDQANRVQGAGGILGGIAHVAQPVARFVSQFMKSGLFLAVEGFYCLRHRVSLRDVPLAHKLLSSLLVSPQLGLRDGVTVIAAVESLFAQAERDRRESIKQTKNLYKLNGVETTSAGDDEFDKVREGRAAIIDQKLTLITPTMDLSGCLSLVQSVWDAFVGANEEKRVLFDLAVRFIPYATDPLKIIKTVAEIPAGVRAASIEQFVFLRSTDATECDKINRLNTFVNCIAAIAEEERESVIEQALRLITPKMLYEDRKNILKGVADVPAEERESVVTQALLLITPELRGWECAKIIVAVAKVPAEERESVIEQTLRLFTPEMLYEGCEKILKGVADVPAEERESVITQALQLVTPDESVDTRLWVIKVISGVPKEERESTIEQAFRLTAHADEEWNGHNGFPIIEAVARVPAEERESFVTQALLLITPEMGGWDRKEIIEAVARVPAEERESVVTQALLLITPETNSAERLRIILAVARVPAEERESVIEQALRLIPLDEMHTQSLSEIIKAVAKVPAREREDVIELLLHIITPEMNFLTRVAIAHAAAAVPAAERADFIALTVEGIIPGLFTPTMSGSVCFEIIAVVLTIPTQERRDFIRRLQNDVLNPVIQGWDRVIVIQREAEIVRRAHRHPEEREEIVRRHGVDVHEGDRDQRAKEAFERLRAAQPAFSQNQIASAKDQFLAFLEESPLDPADKVLAKNALLAPKEPDESFGPLLDQEGFTLLGLRTTGEELIGRLWLFASSLSEPEQTNAKMGMITALLDSYDAFGRVCNQGKMQRLLIAVLQGRLAGVNIDGRVATIQVPTSQATTMFFQVQAHQEIEELQALLAAAEVFCRENPAVNRQEFLVQIREYAALQGIE